MTAASALIWLSAGTVLAAAGALLRAHLTKNPGRVSFRLWFIESRLGFVGLFYFCALWLVASCATILPVSLFFGFVGDGASASDGTIALAAGMTASSAGLPHLFKLAKGPLTSRFELPLSVARLIHRTDELTTIYFVELISEVLGALSARLVHGDLGRCIPILHATHVEGLVRHCASGLPQGEKGRALGVAKVRTPMQKMRYLLEYLGYANCQRELLLITRKVQDGELDPERDGQVHLDAFQDGEYIEFLLGGGPTPPERRRQRPSD